MVLTLFPDDDDTTEIEWDTVGWALSNSFIDSGVDATAGTAFSPSQELFYSAGGVASYDDWTLCRLTDQSVHLIRHVSMAPTPATMLSMFQEQVYDGNAWAQGGVPPMVASASNTGVVLVSDENPADGMLLATIATDNSIHISKWTASGGWTALTTIPGSAQRQSLAGTGCGSRHPALFWTEGTGPYTLMQSDVSALLGP